MIETSNLLIRPIKPSDKEAIFTYRSDANINKYQNWIPQSIQEVANFISKNPATFNESNTWFQMAIIIKEKDEVIGDIGIHFTDEYQCELGCTLSKEYQRKGFATESLQSVIDYLFKVLNKHRMSVSIDPGNIASIHLFEKLNFRKEAHFCKSFLHNGKWHDDIIYAMLNEDWK